MNGVPELELNRARGTSCDATEAARQTRIPPDAGSALSRGDLRQIRIVVFQRKMRQHQKPCASSKPSGSARNSLTAWFDNGPCGSALVASPPTIRPDFQHVKS